MSPITVSIDSDGDAVVSSRETAMKVRNLRRDPRAWICVVPDAFYGVPFVQVEGNVTIVDLPDAMEGLIDYYRGISGEHPDWDDYRAAMERDQRVLIKLDLTRAGPDAAG
jgi:PPOX class probable F420-dependent enzyme